MNQRNTEPRRHGPKGNLLLAALPAADYERLRPAMTLVALRTGAALKDSESQLRYFYFPVSGLVVLLHTQEGGRSEELAVIGNDGCVGASILLSEGKSPRRAVVQIAGHAYRVEPDAVFAEFHRGGALRFLVLRHIQALLTQISQNAVCSQHHVVEQQLCRWLLLRLDRTAASELRVTQGLIGNMLGVRRQAIARVTAKLHEAGLIEYRRGHLAVPDRDKIEAHACECYAVLRKEMNRLLSSEDPLTAQL